MRRINLGEGLVAVEDEDAPGTFINCAGPYTFFVEGQRTVSLDGQFTAVQLTGILYMITREGEKPWGQQAADGAMSAPGKERT